MEFCTVIFFSLQGWCDFLSHAKHALKAQVILVFRWKTAVF